MLDKVVAPAIDPAPYECVVRPSAARDGSWVVEYPDLPGCFAQTDSRQQAMDQSEALLTNWLARADELGIKAPSPGERTMAKVRIRTTRSLHKDLVEFADQSGLSLNETVIQLLYSGVARWLKQDCLTSEVCMADGNLVSRRAPVTRPGPKAARTKGYSGSWLQRLPKSLADQVDAIRVVDGALSMNVVVGLMVARELERAAQQPSADRTDLVEAA